MKNKYQLNPLFEEKGLLKIFKQGGKVRNAIAGGLKKVKKHTLADPIAAATAFTPIPGTEILGLAYTQAIPSSVRARGYKNILEKPVKSLVKAPIAVPKAAGKTVIKTPEVAYDAAGKLYHDGSFYLSHPGLAAKTAKDKLYSFGDGISKFFKKKFKKLS